MGSIKIKGATSGSMVLTVPDTGSDNIPVAVDSLLAKTGDGSGLSGVGTGKNLIINGDFQVWQRGTSFAVNGYSADRWRNNGSALSSVEKVSGPVNALRVSNATTPAAYEGILQRVEDIQKVSGKTLTISYDIKWNTYSDQNYLWMYAYKTAGRVAVSGTNFTGVMPNVNGRFTKTFDLIELSGESHYLDIRIHGNNSNKGLFDYEITNVKLEVGSVATPFESRSYGEELALCQRYYQTGDGFVQDHNGGSYYNDSRYYFKFSGDMRVTPTVTPTITSLSLGVTKSGVFFHDNALSAGQYHNFGFYADAEL